MVTTEQIKELIGRRDDLRRHLAIEDKLVELDEEQSKTLAPDFWDKPEEAEKQLRKVKGRMDLQLKIIAELMRLQHQKSQNRLLQRMTVRRK